MSKHEERKLIKHNKRLEKLEETKVECGIFVLKTLDEVKIFRKKGQLLTNLDVAEDFMSEFANELCVNPTLDDQSLLKPLIIELLSRSLPARDMVNGAIDVKALVKVAGILAESELFQIPKPPTKKVAQKKKLPEDEESSEET